MLVECPKCGSAYARYDRTDTDLLLKCLCGYNKVIFTTLGEAEIVHTDTGKEVSLPKEGTKLRKTLMTLASLVEVSTGEITQRLHDLGETFTASDVASYLTILRSKGLVESTVIRRGFTGGSTWCLTDAADDLINT